MKISFPDIIKIEKTNQFKIDWSGLRIRNIDKTKYIVSVELVYIDSIFVNAEYNGGIGDNKIYLSSIAGDTSIDMDNQWDSEHCINCHFFSNNLNNTALSPTSIRVKIINNNNATEILYNNLIPYIGVGQDYKLYIYPTNTRENVKIIFSTLDEFKPTELLHILVTKNNYTTELIETNEKGIYEGVYIRPFTTCRKDGKSKVLIGVKVKDKNNRLVDLNGNVVDGLEYTTSVIKYLNYIPDSENDYVGTKVNLEQTDGYFEAHEPAAAVLERENRKLFKFTWSDVTPHNLYPKPEYYTLIPKLNNDLINFNISKNKHLHKYYLLDEDIETDGYIIANFTRNHNLSYGYPLPIDLSKKDKTQILTWDGTIATEFSGGTGTKEDPFIINTPQELARAILRDGKTREAIWREKYPSSTLPWDKALPAGTPPVWATLPSLYYEVNSNIYAFDMAGFSNITLDSSYKKIKSVFDTSFDNEAHYPQVDTETLWGKEISSNAGYCFTGHLNGNGIIIYNLKVSTQQDACAFIPWVHGGSIENLILKYCYFHSPGSRISGLPIGGMAAIIGAHHNIADVDKTVIKLNRCAVINCYICCNQTRNKSKAIVMAHMIGNLRWHLAEVTNCIVINNTLLYLDNYSTPLTVGGYIGVYQSWSGTIGRHNDYKHPKITDSIIVGHNFIPTGELLLSPMAHLGFELDGNYYKKDQNGNYIPINPNHQFLLFYRDLEIGADHRTGNNCYTNKTKIYSAAAMGDMNHSYDYSIERSSIQLKDDKVWNFTSGIVWKREYDNETKKWELIASTIWFPTIINYNLSDFSKYFYIDTNKYELAINEQFSETNDIILLNIKPYYFKNDELSIPTTNYSLQITLINNSIVYIKSPITSNYMAKNIYIKRKDNGEYIKALKIYLKQKDGSYIQAF